MPVPVRNAINSPALAPKVFATAGLPAARRVELWESHNAAALVGLAVRAGEVLDATETNLQLPGVKLARVVGTAHAVERSPAVIARSPADSVAIYLTLRGDAWFTSADGTRRLRPGDALVCPTDRPFERAFAHGLEELVVTVPCSAFAISRAGQSEITSFRTTGPLSGTGQYARALARLTGRATRAEGTLPPDERTVLDLAAVLVAGKDAAQATAHRAAAHLYIEEHLADPGLSADEIAAAAGISERHLSRVFAAEGTSVPRHILTHRLQLAYATLRDGAGETVADVAARCGFTSATYFSHVFREHFGFRAGELRRAAAATEAGTADR